jgi:hypothetical protein
MASDADFHFIMGTILCQKTDSPLCKALEKSGIIDVGGITSLTDRVIDRLKYRDDSSGTVVVEELGHGYQQLIRCFNAFVLMKNVEGNPIHGDWQNLTLKSEFQEFWIIGFATYTVTQAPTPSMVTSGGHAGVNTSRPQIRDRVFEFKKGIKRDPASFTVLKDNKQWDSVHRTLKAQTCYQDVGDILNPRYVPQTTEDIALFHEKQKYMYSVLERILQTDEGKVIVRSHDADRNAQVIYAEFLHVMTQSTEALMDSGELLSYLTTAKISDGSWRGTTKTFVLNWIDKLRMFHELTSVADRLSENTQRTLLQNAVIGLNALRQVQINSDLQQATRGTVLTFAQYRSLLLNAATGYDKRSDKPNSNGKPRRSVFNSETLFEDQSRLNDDASYEDDTHELDYDVDTTAGELQAYAMNRRERPQFKSGSRMPIARWKALSEQAKTIWDTMEDDDKALILALQEKRKTTPQSDQSKFSVNTHLTQDTASDNIDDVLLAMVTKHSNRAKSSSHPADIRSVLSQPAKAAKA